MALKTMLPTIKPDLSLINSIIELKDFRSLPRLIRDLKSLKAFRGTTIREKLRGSADVYLQEKFNVAPLISDINALWGVLIKTEKRLNALMSRQGRIIKSHFQRFLSEMVDTHESGSQRSLDGWAPRTGWESNIVPITGYETSERFVYNDASVFHAEVEFSYYYHQYQTEHARLLSVLDQLGVNFNPAIIWNAIPWSFAVDWVIGVSRWLNDNRIGFMDPAVCIHRALWSIKRSRRILVQTQIVCNQEGGGMMAPQYHVQPMVTETAYRRSLWTLSDVVSSIKLSGLNATE